MLPASRPSAPAAAWVIFRKETLEVLRDRRAMFFGVALPVLLYPVLYLGVAPALRTDRSGKELRIGVSGGDALLASCFEAQLISLVPAEFHPELLREGGLSLFLEIRTDLEPTERRRVDVHYVSTSPDSVEALRRVREALEDYRGRLLDDRFRRRGLLGEASKVITLEARDLSDDKERSISKLATFLPLLLVLLLFSGGSFVALDLVAGEKERGTLETLYVHPISSEAIVWGKFLTLFAASVLFAAFNTLGLFLSFWLGAVTGMAPKGLAAPGAVLPPLDALGAILLILIPLVLLASAVLLVISARSHSFREAQTQLFPVTLVALGLVLLALSPSAKLASVISVVPVANIALAIREALRGEVTVLPFALAFLSSCAYAGLVLSRAARLLRREDVILNLEPPFILEDARAEGRARRGLIFGAFMLLFLYYAASWVQARDPYGGLAITLWIFVLAPALLYPLLVRAPYRETLALCPARPVSYVLAAPLAGSMVVAVTAYMAIQNLFLEAPTAFEEAFKEFFVREDLTTVQALLLFAVSPGICEELLWRGALQGELEPEKRPVRTALLVGLFFGLFHQSIYRLVPTAMLGSVLALVRMRSGSIFPCMLVHVAYNAIFFALAQLEAAGRLEGLDRWILDPWAIIAAAALGPICLWGMGHRRKFAAT